MIETDISFGGKFHLLRQTAEETKSLSEKRSSDVSLHCRRRRRRRRHPFHRLLEFYSIEWHHSKLSFISN